MYLQMSRLRSILFLIVYCLVFEGACIGQEKPQYTPDGKQLLLPKGFEKWNFVGANLGLGYSKEAKGITEEESARNNVDLKTESAKDEPNPGEFHNIFLAPNAFNTYTSTGKFPEGTILVMDVYAARRKEPQNIVDRGFYEAERTKIEVAVKNSSRPDQRPDSKANWAYYFFAKGPDGKFQRSATAMPDKTCFDCHKAHADDDHVWVQFYPVIRKK